MFILLTIMLKFFYYYFLIIFVPYAFIYVVLFFFFIAVKQIYQYCKGPRPPAGPSPLRAINYGYPHHILAGCQPSVNSPSVALLPLLCAIEVRSSVQV